MEDNLVKIGGTHQSLDVLFVLKITNIICEKKAVMIQVCCHAKFFLFFFFLLLILS